MSNFFVDCVAPDSALHCVPSTRISPTKDALKMSATKDVVLNLRSKMVLNLSAIKHVVLNLSAY